MISFFLFMPQSYAGAGDKYRPGTRSIHGNTSLSPQPIRGTRCDGVEVGTRASVLALARRADPEDLPATGIGRRNEPVRAVTRTEPRAAKAAQRLERQVRDVDVQDHRAIERRHQQPLYDEAGDPRRSSEIRLTRCGAPQRAGDRRQTEEAALDGCGQQSINGKPAMKPFWDITPAEVKSCLQATTWHPSITEYFPGGGWSTRYVTRGGMPATIFRLNLVEGIGPALQIAEGETVELPPKTHKALEERTNPTWPTTWFVPRLTDKGAFRDVYSVMNNWGANHCVMSYGHIGADLVTLASVLRIPVYMHNLNESQVFRPSAWAAFGTDDLTGADFRACQNFGPLYR